MKLALITDTHWGVRNDQYTFLENNKKFLDDVFFPTLEKNGIKRILHGGDLTDRRKFINFLTARRLRNDFINPALDRGIEMDIVIGNHDTYYKDTNEVNSVRELYSDTGRNANFRWYENATEIEADGLKVLLLPWICAANKEHTFETIEKSTAQVVLGHLELDGFEMYRGVPAHGGMDSSVFTKFDQVFSGHYHTQSEQGNIRYLGAHAEFTWADYNDPRGFHIFDTDTRLLTFVSNPYRMFEKVFYNEAEYSSLRDIEEIDFSNVNSKYVKVIVQGLKEPTWFDLFVDRLERETPIDVSVVDDHQNQDATEDEEIIDEADDTITVMRKWIDNANTSGIDKSRLLNYIVKLHTRALSIE